MPKKCIMILLDGLGDRSYPLLSHQTPLQAANTPVLDYLARNGANGLYHAAGLGQALPSENAHFAMFGYDADDFPGRGALEALGAGLSISADDVAVLAHFVCVSRRPDNVLILENGNPQVTDGEIRDLIRDVGELAFNGINVRLRHTHGIRGILSLSGRVSPYVTDSDPITDHRPLSALRPWAGHEGDMAAEATANAIESYLSWAHRQLEQHPVNRSRSKAGQPLLNGLVTQRAGRLKPVEPFSKWYGLKGISIARGLVYHGLAAYLGMGVCKVSDSGQPGTDLAERLRMALDLLSTYDFIHVHTKTPDEAAHTKDPEAKVRVIEALDLGIGTVLEALKAHPDLLMVVTADHSTPSAGPLIHSGEPVPLIFHGPGIRRDLASSYDEVAAAGGALGLVRGKELMYLILNHMDRAKLQGIMDTPVDQPFWPGNYEPFRLNNTD